MNVNPWKVYFSRSSGLGFLRSISHRCGESKRSIATRGLDSQKKSKSFTPRNQHSRQVSNASLASKAIDYLDLDRKILQLDDFYTNGLPAAKFSLRENDLLKQEISTKSIYDIFEENQHADPFATVQADITHLTDSISNEIIATDHPLLRKVANYYFQKSGKYIRPAVVLLIARAMSESGTLMDSQRRLSEITEMIHTASLLHDDVIDEADTRRGAPSTNAAHGNKVSILGGDFLLSRDSVALSRLRDPTVIELVSIVIEHLVKGEIMQIRPNEKLDPMSNYLVKTYYKTASLMANSCKAVAVLGGHDTKAQDIAWEYGTHLGLAFQIVDDILDFTSTSGILGKPILNDINNGLSTAPVILAAEKFPELRPLMKRKFRTPGDIETALDLIEKSDAIQMSRDLAMQHCENALAAILELPPSVARSSLIKIVDIVQSRKK